MSNNITEAQRKLAEIAENNPQLSYKELAELLGCSQQTVSRLCVKCGVRRKRGPVTDADLAKLVDTNCNQPETGTTHEGDKTHAS
jgi:DeoR/GlpR family transcriptional regulator of sugar metabolism